MTDARRTAALAYLVAGSFFMENLDGTVITTAIPQMARSFHSDVVGLNVGITAYLLALAVFVPMSGWLADRFGARNIFASAIAIFTVSSIFCGVSQTLPEFTLARVIQGMGGAMMVPVGRLVVLRNTEKRDLVKAISTIVWPGLVAPVLGPPLGGFITDHATWRWIFFLNIPLGLIALTIALRIVPNLKTEERTPFDWAGFVLVGLACTFLTLGLDKLSLGLFAVGIVFGIAAIYYLRRAVHPLMRFEALKIQTFALTLWGGSLARAAIGGMPFLLALYLQVGFGLTAYESGKLVLWVFAGNLTMKTMTTAMLRRFGFQRTLQVNGFLATASIGSIAFLAPDTPYPLMAALLFAGGLFRSMQFTALNTLGFADVPPEQMSAATTLSSTIGGLTFGAGVAFGAFALQIGRWLHATKTVDPSLADFRFAFGLVALMALGSLWDSFKLPGDAGQEVSGHRKPV
jgi:EmrB/QacA subfamily drug resistance transporter